MTKDIIIYGKTKGEIIDKAKKYTNTFVVDENFTGSFEEAQKRHKSLNMNIMSFYDNEKTNKLEEELGCKILEKAAAKKVVDLGVAPAGEIAKNYLLYHRLEEEVKVLSAKIEQLTSINKGLLTFSF